MRLMLAIVILMTYSCSSAPAKEACVPFHSGNFEMRDGNKTYLVTRQDSLQVEIALGRTDTAYSKIKWLNDCEYELTYIPTRKSYTHPYISKMALYQFNVKIIKAEKNYCIYEFGKAGIDEKIVDTLMIKE